jgi:hypothetical protein
MSDVARQSVTYLGARPGEWPSCSDPLDGSGGTVFDGSNSKVEQVVTKVFLPNVDDAQQSLCCSA